MSSSNAKSRQVVITGVGVMSPIGIGADAFWDSLKCGRSGIAASQLLSNIAAPNDIVGEVSEFTLSTAKKIYLKKQRKNIKVMCREIQLGVASAMQAIEQSQLDLDSFDHTRMGVDFGANLMSSPPDVLYDAAIKCVEDGGEFQFDKWGEAGITGMQPLWLLCYLPNMPGCHIGIAADARGPNNSITLDEASGNLVIGEASRIIERDRADIMIAGTTGTRVHPVKSMHAVLWDEVAKEPPEPEKRSRPFDLNRSGEVMAEGACSVILEDENHARNRGATIYGRILGHGSSCVADTNGKAGRKQALMNAMQSALEQAQLKPEDIGHINAHGVGSRITDQQEASAIGEVFGSQSTTVPVTALKSYFGNSGSGCGVMELAGSLPALNGEPIPATLNFETPDPECPLNIVAKPTPSDKPVVLNINVTRIGQASALIVGKAS